MYANVNKSNTGKLLAAVLAIAMIVSGVAIFSGESVNAATWNMDGDINANQDIQPGTDAVARDDFNVGVTNPAILTIKDGASFVINEGVTVTIRSGSTMVIENGAAVEINGTLVIQDGATLQNGANYDGTNTVSGHSTGLIVNGALSVARGGIVEGASVASGYDISELTQNNNTGISVVTNADYTTGSGTLAVYDNGENSYVVDISDYIVSPHLNGVGDMGNWIAVKLPSSLTSATAGQAVSINYDGRNSNTSDVVLSDNSINIWMDAGDVSTVTVTVNQTTYTLIIDTTGVTIGSSYGTNMIAGDIVIGANGTVTTSSSNSSKSFVDHQTFYVATGGTVNLNSVANDITVQAMPTTDRYPYTYGQLTINSAGTTTQASGTAVDLTFTVSTESISSAFTANDEKTTRASNYILDVSGNINENNEVRTVGTSAVYGQYGNLYYPNADDENSNIPMMGIVSINDTLNVRGLGSTFAVAEGSIVDVNGTLNVNGNNDGKASIRVAGTLNVSGSVDLGSISDDNGININTYNTGYLNIIDAGNVQIDDATISTLNLNISGAAYETNDAVFFMGLQAAIDAAVAANENDVYVYGYDGNNVVPDQPYVITADVSVPDTISLSVNGLMTVSEGATLTIPENAEITTDEGATITVEGTVIDYTLYGFINSGSPGASDILMIAEVRSMDEAETYYMYTTLANALAGAATTIELYGDVDVDGTLEIPAGYTVELNGHKINVLNNSSLIISGVIDSTEANSQIVVAAENKTNNEAAGSVTLNNMIVNPNVVNDDSSPVSVTLNGFTATGTIGDYENTTFALAPEVAAANSATLENIVAVGEFSYNGTLTFTAGEDTPTNEVITIRTSNTDGNTNNNVISIGIIVLDGFGFTIDGADGAFTGTVQSDVGAVAFNAAENYSISFSEEDTGDQYVTHMNLSVVASTTADGSVTITSGVVCLDSNVTFGADQNKILTVASGATLNIEDFILSTAARATGEGVPTGYSAIIVEGTLNISRANGISMNATSSIQIDGTMNVTNGITFAGNVYVDGTLAVTDGERTTGSVTVDNTMYVSGVVSGAVIIDSADVIIAYPGATIDTENLEDNSGNAAVSTQFYINGNLYMTAYGANEKSVSSIITNETFELEGYEAPSKTTDNDEYQSWFTDADMTQNLSTSATMQYTSAVYTKVNPISVDNIRVSIGEGLQVYVDGVRVTNGFLTGTQAYVGDHTIEVTISPGYTGEIVITFNGQTVQNGGTFTITPQMANPTADEVVLSVTSQLSIDTGSTDSSDDGMGLTDYLLIILVVLIVIMAIMVAMRLMRS